MKKSVGVLGGSVAHDYVKSTFGDTVDLKINPDVAIPGGAPTANALLQTPLSVYRCPSDPGQSVNSVLNNYGMNNYVVNREVVGPDASNRPAPMKVERITDGSSNTVMLGERDSIRNIGAVWVRASGSPLTS